MIELKSDAAALAVDTALGGRIVSLLVGGVERILPKANARPSPLATGWGCYPMAPWPGRLSEGRIPTEEGEVRLEQNRPPTAIHGLVFDKPWSVVTQSDDGSR